MKKNNWDETEIENLLREMPSMKDSRNRKEIYAAVDRSSVKKKPNTWGYPAIAGVAALLILFLITPSLFDYSNQSQYENSAADMAAEDSGEAGSPQKEMASIQETEENPVLDDSSSNAESRQQSLMGKAETSERSNVYQDDLLQYDLITFGLVTPDASVVPVSVLSEKRESAGWLERFVDVSEEIPEQSWGFDEYYPLTGKLELNEDTGELVYTVTEEEMTNPGGGGEDIFYDSIAFTLEGSGYEKVNLQKEDGTVPLFSHMGEISEVPKAGPSNKGYYKYSLPNGDTYLVPGEGEHKNISDALEGMKMSPNSLYEPLIPEKLNLKASSDNNLLTISFGETLKLNEEIDPLFAEALLLTAKEFGYEEVLFKNIEGTSWNGFDFSEPISVPVSPNRKTVN
ncbi:hypothetical protein FZC78_05680 [Rossellomorea vietnamensis]|uniref:Uncharacterized protein n=1 Tax=Rossellomorea vietnamensis TaxID=218284 RepID=A0A5D4P2I5_9BACI|nr:hypothetical protein [Rossellomorea vietnamensis]TYS18982.1 hypothetical protein FZC78_05680 [Rossellomorea vietnamensis]